MHVVDLTSTKCQNLVHQTCAGSDPAGTVSLRAMPITHPIFSQISDEP